MSENLYFSTLSSLSAFSPFLSIPLVFFLNNSPYPTISSPSRTCSIRAKKNHTDNGCSFLHREAIEDAISGREEVEEWWKKHGLSRYSNAQNWTKSRVLGR